MKLNTGMRCHDLCPKMEMEKLFAQVREHDIRQIQLAFGMFSLLFFVRFFRKLGSNLNLISLFLS